VVDGGAKDDDARFRATSVHPWVMAHSDRLAMAHGESQPKQSGPLVLALQRVPAHGGDLSADGWVLHVLVGRKCSDWDGPRAEGLLGGQHHCCGEVGALLRRARHTYCWCSDGCDFESEERRLPHQQLGQFLGHKERLYSDLALHARETSAMV
jgi:hypothetical protein